MAFSGAGVFSRIHSWIADRDNGIKITAVRHDAEDDGFATGLSNCICRDGQSTVTAAIPFSSQRITGLGNATADADALNRITADGRYLVHGQCYLSWTSTLLLTLSPCNGNQIVIDGVRQTIPAAGVTLSPLSSAASTVYAIYAYMNASTVTLEYSLTAPVADATTGVLIKTGDASRSFVGYAISGGNIWLAETSAIVSTMSWFNPRRRTLSASSSNATAATSYLTTETLSGFTHPQRPARLSASGYHYNGGGTPGAMFTQITTNTGLVVSGETVTHSVAANEYKSFAVEGFYVTSGWYPFELRIKVDNGTSSWFWTMHYEFWG